MDSSGQGIKYPEDGLNAEESAVISEEEQSLKKVQVPDPLFSPSFIRFPGFLIYGFGK